METLGFVFGLCGFSVRTVFLPWVCGINIFILVLLQNFFFCKFTHDSGNWGRRIFNSVTVSSQARLHYKILCYLKMMIITIFIFNVELIKLNLNIVGGITPLMLGWVPLKRFRSMSVLCNDWFSKVSKQWQMWTVPMFLAQEKGYVWRVKV